MDGALGALEGAGAGLGAAAAGAAAAGLAAAAGAAAAGAAAAGAAAAGAAGAGILIVGEAVGFGGRLMRTVSFFGCTLDASAGFGGTASPAGDVGALSAIMIRSFKLGSPAAGVKPLSSLFHSLLQVRALPFNC